MSTPVNVFSSGYVPPGVYVSTKSTGSTGAVGIGDTVVCLVGRGIGYQVATEAISFANSDSVTLKPTGINPAAQVTDPNTGVTTGSIIAISPSAGATPYQMDDPSTPTNPSGTPHDYSVVQSDDALAANKTTTIVRTPTGRIPKGSTLVRYHYTDPNYFALHSFTDYATFTAIYGPALDPVTGAINSPLSLAAQFAFQNGANILYAVAIDTSLGHGMPDQFTAAYALTVPNYDINIMVPLFEDAIDESSMTGELGPLKSFLQSADASGFPRIAIIGAANPSNDPVSPQPNNADPAAIASSDANYRRIVFLWPPQYQMFNPVRTANGTVNVDGYYAAAAAAGFLANNDPNQGLTQTAIQGFTGLSAAVLAATASPTLKNMWSSSGVSVYEQNRLNALTCRHGVTTDTSDVGTREISIVRCQDALFVEIELTLLESGLIGTPITDSTGLNVKSLITGALEAASANATIASYDSVVVSQQTLPSGDPTVIEVSFNYQPTYPLNYITVTFTLDLSTGNISAPITDTAGEGPSGLQAAG